jgi:hypothetical protein
VVFATFPTVRSELTRRAFISEVADCGTVVDLVALHDVPRNLPTKGTMLIAPFTESDTLQTSARVSAIQGESTVNVMVDPKIGTV